LRWPRGGVLHAQALLTVGLAAILTVIAFAADGGLRVGRTMPVELGLVLGGGLLIAAALLLTPRPERVWGLGSLGAVVALAALTALSLAWAINPSDAWLEANRTLAYTAVFAAAVAMAHAAGHRWSAVLGAITLAAVAVSAYAVATKVFPGVLSSDEVYARLREPFGYWNAVGLMAALGVPGCLWLGARRDGHAALNALAHPALGLLLVTIMLSYSRGALLALGVGVAFWLAVVPLRLRGAAVLLSGAVGAALVTGWVFTQDALTEDRVPLDLRESAGYQLGLLLAVVLGLLTLAGLAVAFASALRPPSARDRRRAGIALLCALALVPVGVAVGLAFSSRGLTGSISHGWTQLTDPSATQPSNDPGRLTAAGSVRARYWDDALEIFSDNTAAGTGAGGFATARPRYRNDDLDVRHAHGYVVQTLADLGLLGLAVSLLALVAWALAAARATGLRPRDRGRPFDAERIGLLTLVAVVIVFGVHSFVDWTWFVPANAAVALLAAGWVAARGPLGTPRPAPAPRPSRARLAAAVRRPALAVPAAATIVVAVLAAWMVAQPQRSITAGQDALAALDAGDLGKARELALSARDRNPLAVDPLYELAVIESSAGRRLAGRRALRQAVRLQPENFDTWTRLAEYELDTLRRPRAALRAIRPALFLNPRSDEAAQVFLTATRQAASRR
jgi:hypothetical protein